MLRRINRSILNAIQRPLKCEDNLVTHLTHPSKALGYDLVRFTIGLNFFPRSSLVTYRNGKGNLDGEEDTSPRECANSGLSKGWRIVL